MGMPSMENVSLHVLYSGSVNGRAEHDKCTASCTVQWVCEWAC